MATIMKVLVSHQFFTTFIKISLNLGSQFDKYGNVQEWWSPDAKNHFDEKKECLIQQYNQFVVPEVNLTVMFQFLYNTIHIS